MGGGAASREGRKLSKCAINKANQGSHFHHLQANSGLYKSSLSVCLTMAKERVCSHCHFHQLLVEDRPGNMHSQTPLSPFVWAQETQKIVPQERGQVLAVGSF